MDSANPEDAVTNTLWFQTVASNPADLDVITNNIANFYTAVKDYLSTALNHNAATVKFYNHEQPPPRVPFYQKNFVYTAPQLGIAALPPELAICVSFKSAYVTGIPTARCRGRIYVGPLNVNTNNEGVVAAAAVTKFKDAAKAFLDASTADTNYVWSTHSHAIGDVSDGTRPVVGGWVDNAFDIQRRRGLGASSRSTFVL